MKRSLASILLLATLLPPQAIAEDDPPRPLSAMALIEDGVAKIYWTPPALSPADLAEATYIVVGVRGGEETELATTGPMEFYVEKPGIAEQYESYGVRTLLGGKVSPMTNVAACIQMDPTSEPPRAEVRCS